MTLASNIVEMEKEVEGLMNAVLISYEKQLLCRRNAITKDEENC